MFIGFSEAFIIHRTPNGVMFSLKTSDPRKINQSIPFVSDDDQKVLMHCLGTFSEDEICSSSGLEPEKCRGILEYYIKLGVLRQYVNEHPTKVTGSSEYFFPQHLTLELTTHCNLKCRHCYRDAGSSKSSFMHFQKLRNCLDNLVPLGVKIIEITGGECFCHPEILDIIEDIALRTEIQIVAVLTNGWQINQKIVERLIPYKEKVIFSISLDSSTALFHDQFRQREGAWEKAVGAIKLLSSSGFLVRAAMSVVPANYFDIEDTLLFAKSIGAITFVWSPVLPTGRGKVYQRAYELFYTNTKIEEISKYESNLRKKYKDYLVTIPEKTLQRMKEGKENCGLGYKTWVVSPEGIVRPCNIMSEAVIQFGNIFEVDLSEMLRNPVINLLSRIPPPNAGLCKECNSISFCPWCIQRGLERISQGELCSWKKNPIVKELLDLINLEEITAQSCQKSIYG